MRTTKTWKYKTKLVALAVFTAASAVFGSFGALAAPASAETPKDSHICYGYNMDGEQLILFIDKALYDEEGCQGIKVSYASHDETYWTSDGYSYVSNCYSTSQLTQYVENICSLPDSQILTLEDYQNDEGCFFEDGHYKEDTVREHCAGTSFYIDFG